MSFRSVFISVFLGAALVVAALIINRERPSRETAQSSAALVRATGKCAECHRMETSAVVHQFELSKHARTGVNCLDCHQPLGGQERVDHRGFALTASVTAKNCSECHSSEYQQFLRSRHAAPAWAAVAGRADFTEEQIAFAETYHAGAVDRPVNALAKKEGKGAEKGCFGCHAIGKPNVDGSIGSCTQCHSRHSTSIALARQPETCGQCHMGPDHSQIEIYHESKHGVLFNAQRGSMNLDADPDQLTTADMPVPTCATCHMSGLENLKVTHDTTERLSYWLFAAVSERRPTYNRGRTEMREVCLKCHASSHVETYFTDAEAILAATNAWTLSPTNDDPTGIKIEFRNLPLSRGTIRIYTLSGDLVKELRFDGTGGVGTVKWDLVSRNGQGVTSGVYLYSIEFQDQRFNRVIKKFTVIR